MTSSVDSSRSHRTKELTASWLSAMLLFGPLSLLAEFLIVRTHHRPLGAATFASIAMLLWIFAEVSTRRFLDAATPGKRARARRILWGVSAACSLGVLVRGLL